MVDLEANTTCAQRWLFLVSALFVFPAASSAQQEPPLVNGNFEQLANNGKAVGWRNSRVEQLPDGNHMLVVPFTWGFNQTFRVRPNTCYLLSMDVKQRRDPSAARMSIGVKDAKGKTVSNAGFYHAFQGDDWETARGLLVTTAAARRATLYVLTLDKDRRAKSGTLFTRAYAANPLCVPSRNSMFTGRYPHETAHRVASALTRDSAWPRQRPPAGPRPNTEWHPGTGR